MRPANRARPPPHGRSASVQSRGPGPALPWMASARRRARSVLLAEPRGFCAGVEMAIKALAWMVRVFEPPVYCYHEIVHNRLVVDRFRELGVVFVDDDRRGARRRPAHALGPRLGARGGRRRHATRAGSSSTRSARSSPRSTTRPRCGPARATRSSTSATRATTRRSARWRSRPTPSAWSSTKTTSTGVLATVGDPSKVALLAQTTLSLHDWQGIADRARSEFPELWTATRNDLCFATTNRQAALPAIAAEADAIVVIGSAELVEHDRAGQGGAGRRLPDRAAHRRPRRARLPTRWATPGSSA